MITLQTLKIMFTISEAGTITRAAELLNTSQPAISQHVRAMEKAIGVPLLDRVGRNVRLTEMGQLLALRAPDILDSVAALESEIAQYKALESGSIRIAAFPSASGTIAATLVARLADAFPALRISYIESDPRNSVRLLRNGTADIVLTFSYPQLSSMMEMYAGSEFATANLFEDDLFLAMPASHPAAQKSALTWDDLTKMQWISGCQRCQEHLNLLTNEAQITASISVQTENFSAMLTLISRGFGVGLIPRLAVANQTIPEGVVLRSFDHVQPRRIQAVTTKGAFTSPVLETALSELLKIDGAEWGLRNIAKARSAKV